MNSNQEWAPISPEFQQPSQKKGLFTLSPATKAKWRKFKLRATYIGVILAIAFIYIKATNSNNLSASGYSRIQMIEARESGTYNSQVPVNPTPAPVQRRRVRYINLSEYMEGLPYPVRLHIGQYHGNGDFSYCSTNYTACLYLRSHLTPYGVQITE